MSGNRRLVILISGRGSNCLALVDAARRGWLGFEIAAVISDRPGAPGLELAGGAGVDTVVVDASAYSDRGDFESALAVVIEGFAPERIALAGFMRILSAGFLDRFPGQMLNIHPSLLPRFRGLDTHTRVLEAGESEHGASIHLVTPELDAGPVLARARVPVKDEDTPDSLAERVLAVEHRLYPAVMALLSRCLVELRNDVIHLEGKPLARPLELGVDLDDRGHRIRDD